MRRPGFLRGVCLNTSVAHALRSSFAVASVLALSIAPAAGGVETRATARAAASLELSKSADAETVEAGNPIGFRIDLTNHGDPPNQGRVIIEKRLDPNWATGTFAFSTNLPGTGSFSLGAPVGPPANLLRIKTFKAVAPGTYTVTEEPPPAGFTVIGVTCDDPNFNSTGDVDTGRATISLQAGETVRCVFTNHDSTIAPDGRGVVIVEKQAPATHDPSLEPAGAFTDDLPPCLFTGIPSGSEQICANVVPGTYAVTETDISGSGHLVSLRCDDANSTWDLATRRATIRVEANETVRCVWINAAQAGNGAATNVRLTDQLPAGPGLSWSIDPAVSGCSLLNQVLSCSFAKLGDGETMSVHVTSPTTSASCGRYPNTAVASADNRARVEASASITVVCPGHIVVRKVTRPSPDPTDTSFSFTGGGGLSPASFSLKNGESRTFANLAPQAGYSLAENTPAGWDLTSACSDDSLISNIDVGPGETVICTVTNAKRGSVTLKKTTNGVVDPSKDILFILTGPGLPADGVRRSTFGDPDGLLEFGDANLVPDKTYTMCETPVPAGFTSFWKLDHDIVTPYNPDATRTPPEDLGTRCHDFKVEPGQERAFDVDNSRPGGDPRTIGYWKNWNRCTGGNQATVAQKNGGASAGFFLVEDLLPQRVGDFSGVSCEQAIRLLSKQDRNGKSKSSDAAYELGAQLLATRFNLAAGAETCDAVQKAVVDGQALLDGINFTGSGDFLGSKSKDAQRQQALALATTLDRYNNGGLC
jgi:Prealbumin-like fold domain